MGGCRARQSTPWAVDGKRVPGRVSTRKQKLANKNHTGGCGGRGLRTLLSPLCFLSYQVQTQVLVLCCRWQMFEPFFCQMMWEEVGDILANGRKERGNNFRERSQGQGNLRKQNWTLRGP